MLKDKENRERIIDLVMIFMIGSFGLLVLVLVIGLLVALFTDPSVASGGGGGGSF